MSSEFPTPPSPKRPLAKPRSANLNRRDLIFRLVVLVVIAAALGLAWRSFNRLALLQKQSRELNSTVVRLSAEVDTLDRRWSEGDARQITNRFGQVRSRLFTGQVALDSWLAALHVQAAPLALDLKAELAPTIPQTTNNEKLAIIPATVRIQPLWTPSMESMESSYQRILRLSQQLTAQDQRADVAELTVTGGTNSISQAVVLLNLWAGEDRTQ
jgi:hypothetical protein